MGPAVVVVREVMLLMLGGGDGDGGIVGRDGGERFFVRHVDRASCPAWGS